MVIPEERHTISIVSSTEWEIPSDETWISLAVENTNTNAITAVKNNADKMNTIIEVLKQVGLSNENVTPFDF